MAKEEKVEKCGQSIGQQWRVVVDQTWAEETTPYLKVKSEHDEARQWWRIAKECEELDLCYPRNRTLANDNSKHFLL